MKLPSFRNLILFLILSILFSLVYLPQKVTYAASNVPANQAWLCLRATVKGPHVVDLTAIKDYEFLPENSTVYVVECYTDPKGLNNCTTGNSTADTTLQLSGPPAGWKITHTISQPVKSDSRGRLTGEPFTWKSEGLPPLDHTYWGVLVVSEDDKDFDNPTLKLDTFYPRDEYAKMCLEPIRWDPTGYVFDSRSLEPINNILVSLYDEAGILANILGVRNPISTDIAGQFNFVVPSGNYSLKVISNTHKFPSTASTLPYQSDPDFPYDHLYRGGNFFEAQETVTYKNIPVDPLGIPYKREAAFLDWTYLLEKVTNTYVFHGGVIHPKSTITAYSNGVSLGSVKADKFGKFLLQVDGKKVNNLKGIQLKVVKPAIMGGSPLSESIWNKLFGVYAAEDAISIQAEPILNYLEGYIINPQTQKPEAEASVTIYADVSKNPFYKTNTDTAGHFSISSDKLPSFKYYLAVTTKTGQKFDLSTSEFASTNQTYLKSTGTIDQEADFGRYIPSNAGTQLTPGQNGFGTSGSGNITTSPDKANNNPNVTDTTNPGTDTKKSGISSGPLSGVSGAVSTLVNSINNLATIKGTNNTSFSLLPYITVLIIIVIVLVIIIRKKKKHAEPPQPIPPVEPPPVTTNQDLTSQGK